MIRFLQSGNRATKYLLAVLMTIIALSMVAYLIPGFMSGDTVNRSGVIARVGGQEISTQDLQRYTDKLIQQSARRGQPIPEGMRGFFMQQALPQLVSRAAIRYEGERMGLSVSDEEIRQFLRTGEYGQLFFPKGEWVGQDKYQTIVTSEFEVSVDDFERDIQLQLLATKLFAAVSAGASVAPSDVEQAYKEQNTKVKFDYAIINMDDVQKQIKPTDAELKSWYDTNKARYQNSIPEKRQVSYFIIPQQQVEAKVTVTPAEIQDYYRSHQNDFRTEDRVRVRHILVKTPTPGPDGKVDQKAVDEARAKAEGVLKQVKAGGDFAELAKKYSDDPGSKDQGGELGWQGRDSGFVAPFKQAMFSLNKGQISDLVQSEFGFHIIQVEDKETAGLKPLNQVKDQIESNRKEQKLADALDQLANQAQVKAAKESIDKAAADYGVTVIKTNPIAPGDSLPGIGAGPASSELMNGIFQVKENSQAQGTRTPQGVVVFKVDKVIPRSSPTFEAIKERVTNDFKSERASVLVSQKTTELSDRARTEHDLRKAAKEAGATFKSSDLVGRTSQVPEIGSMGSGTANSIFKLKPGEISNALNIGRNGAVVALTDRQEPSTTGDEFAKAKDNLYEQLMQEKRQEAIGLFVSNLQDRLEKEGKLKVNKNELGNLTRGT